MEPSTRPELVIRRNETGETIRMHRVRHAEGRESLRLFVTLPAGEEGPPPHIHFAEDEGGRIVRGTVGAEIDGEEVQLGPGDEAAFPRGIVHQWWNAGDEELAVDGWASPAVDLDRYLQAMFEVFNAGRNGRPSLFYIAHVVHRHRATQLALVMPRLIQRLLLPPVILLGRLLGKYRGTDWPGCPQRCTGAPVVRGSAGEAA